MRRLYPSRSSVTQGFSGGRMPPADRGNPKLLFDAQRFVNQLLAVRDVLGELHVGALLRDLDPLVVLRVAQTLDLDAVVLVSLNRRLVDRFRLVFVVLMRFLSGLDKRVMLLLVELVEALFRHEQGLVHHPQRVSAWYGQAFCLLI